MSHELRLSRAARRALAETLPESVAAARSVRAGEIDNRAAYAGFGLAYVQKRRLR